MPRSGRFRHRAETPLTRLGAAGRRHRRTMVAGVVMTVLSAFAIIGPASAAAAPMTLPPPYSVGGIDVSSWQGGDIDWPGVAATQNARFAYAKASEGTYYTNPYFDAQYNGAKNAGLYAGAYAFAIPNAPALAQADYFLDRAQFASDGHTMPPMLDLEWPYQSGGSYIAPYPCYGLSPADMVAWIRAFVDEVKRRTGSPTMIYTNPNWWNPCTGNTTAFSDQLLDEASYTSTQPSTIASSWDHWTIWQFANHGALPGDQNAFVGGSADLDQMVAHLGCQHVPSDFNGDGFADTVVGEPHHTVLGLAGAGGIRVTYGSADGFGASNARYLDQTSGGVVGNAVANGAFGTAVATGYFNDDCFADVAVGAPGAGNGTVTILYGSPDGLTSANSMVLTGHSAAGRFGATLATGDVNGDRKSDLVVGAPGANSGAGEIAVAYSGSAKLGNALYYYDENSTGIPGTRAPADKFGAALVVADFTGDQVDDIAVGEPGKKYGTLGSAGEVIVIKGVKFSSKLGPGSTGWTQGTAGVPGDPTAGDSFGASLAAGDTNADHLADLAIGVPGETTAGTSQHQGMVEILSGAPSGLTTANIKAYTQDSTNVPDTGEKDDRFGTTLAMGDFNGDGRADLAVGTPWEDVGAIKDAGMVTILYGSATGTTTTGSVAFSQGAGGVPGKVRLTGRFGWTLHTALINSGYATLLVGTPYDTVTVANDGSVTVLPGGADGLSATGATWLGEVGLTFGDQQLPAPLASDQFGASIG